MSFDFYVDLGSLQACPADCSLPSGLAAGFVDGCSVVFHWAEIQRAIAEKQEKSAPQRSQQKKTAQRQRREAEQQKNQARSCYMNEAAKETLSLPSELELNPWPPNLLHQNWLAFEIEFELLTSWYSKDDRFFHPLDNPVRKDRVFGVPFMSAASWKGLLRWACRMQADLQKHLEQGKRFKEWKDPNWILHLFGNEKGEEEYFHQGALVFYPTWFDRIGFELINPHSRERRAGTKPIYYEVVPPGAKGTLYLLYAPWPGMKPAADPTEFLPKLLEAIETLLTTYGISAKRTVGWGTAKIMEWKAFRKGQQPVEGNNRGQLWEQIKSWFQTGGMP